MTFFAFVSSVEVSAKPKKAKYGIIKIQSDPGGLLVTIDGIPRGETVKNDYRSIQLDAGMHTVSVTLPNGKLWTREIEVPAGRVKCVNVNYRPLPPMAKSPCPYPVNVSAPQTVNEGEIITFAADVSYGGAGNLRYVWTVNPTAAKVISGAGTPTITVDSTGLGAQRVIATSWSTIDRAIRCAVRVRRALRWSVRRKEKLSLRVSLTSATTARSTIKSAAR